jgi:hypothetical protein
MSNRTVTLGFGIINVLFICAATADIFHWSAWFAFWPTIIIEILFFISLWYDSVKDKE